MRSWVAAEDQPAARGGDAFGRFSALAVSRRASGRTWTWDSRKTDSPSPADDRVEIPDDMHEEEEEEQWAPTLILPGEANRDQPMPPLPRLLTAHATPADAASQRRHAPARRGSALQSLRAFGRRAGRCVRAAACLRTASGITQAAAGVAVAALASRALPQRAHAAGGRPTAGERGKPRRRRRVQGIGGFGACDGCSALNLCGPRSWGIAPFPTSSRACPTSSNATAAAAVGDGPHEDTWHGWHPAAV